jgi:hypothetical protein
MTNYWLDRAEAIMERELIIVKSSPETKNWYNRMPSVIPIIYPDKKQPTYPSEFGPKVGIAHHLRYNNHGIEAVMKAPRKYHRLNCYVLYDQVNQPADPFWIILFRSQTSI